MTTISTMALNHLRRMTLVAEPGAYLGSENDLIAALGVSRPTLRQICQALVQEGVLSVRQGSSGGYFAQRPTSQHVGRMTAIFLHSQGCSSDEIWDVFSPVVVALTKRAAGQPSATRHHALAAFASAQRAVPADGLNADGLNAEAFAKADYELAKIMTDLAGSVTLSLFSDILFSFRLHFGGGYRWAQDPAKLATIATIRRQMVEAVIGGEEQAAVLYLETMMGLLRAWLKEFPSDPPDWSDLIDS